MTPTVCCLFRNRTPLGVNGDDLLTALQAYVSGPVKEHWPEADCTLVNRGMGQGDWGEMIFLDDADQAGALGYHVWVGWPRMFVFVRTARGEGDDVSVVASHELVEGRKDPMCNLVVGTPRGRYAAYGELSDMVEGEAFEVKGLPVSDFVLPAWYDRPSQTATSGGSRSPFDYLGRCTQAWEVLPGGYVPVLDPATGQWSEVFGSAAAECRFRLQDRRLRRSERRKSRAARVQPTSVADSGSPRAASQRVLV